jgi:non-ribosomal peptide synthetase component F
MTIDQGATFDDGFWDQLDRRHPGDSSAAALTSVVPWESSVLSSAQERFWLLESVHGGVRSHLTYIVVHLTGPVDLVNLQAAIDTVVERHEMLRMGLYCENGELRQRVGHDVRAGLQVETREAPAGQARVVIDQWVDDTLAVAFDLSVPPILRAGLLRLGSQDHVLLLASHRAVADSPSLRILLADLTASYAALAKGTEPGLDDIPAGTAHPAAWEQANLERDGYEDDLAYWMAHLWNTDYTVLPPADRSLAERSSTGGERRSAPLDRDTIDGLQIRLGLPAHAILLTAYAQLLARYTGKDDLTIAVPDTLRHLGDLGSVVGPFGNTLVLHIDLSGNPTFAELAGKVTALLRDSLTRRKVPVEILLRTMWSENHPEHGPLAKAAFDVGGPLPPDTKSAGLHLSVLDHSRRCEEYPLTLRVIAADGEFRAEIHHRGTDTSAELIEVFLATYRLLLERIADDPDRRVQDVRLFGPDPCAWAVPQKAQRYPLITELVARATRQAPDAPILVQGDRSWSYEQLDIRASELAEVLRKVGHGAGETVVICPAKRCFDLYAGLLGVWQAGGVVALLDPARPHAEREAMMARARGRTLLLIGDRPPGWWPTTDAANVVLVSPGQAMSVLRHRPGRPNPLSDESAAYVFFTSGTTGAPKALLGRHTSLAHFVLWQQQEFGYSTDDRCAQLTSLFTDGVLRDIFTPLVSGSPLYLPADPAMRSYDPAVLGWLCDSGITRAHTMPSTSARWLGGARAGEPLETLRHLFFSGEPLTAGLTDHWHRMAPNAQLVNLYGTSECTMVQAFHRVRRRPAFRTHPAGRGMPGAQLLALTPSGTPCGPGEVGQVHIRTPYSTSGYLDHAESAFIPNVFRDDPTDLVFRTEDHGRGRPDGTLEILGRSSDTARTRGVRLHPERVNTVLAGLTGVEASAVVPIDSIDKALGLAAFVVLDRVDAAGMWGIRSALRRHLSPAEVPSHVIPMTELPVTAVGKLDRRALRNAFLRHRTADQANLNHSTLAVTAASVWSTVLDGAPIQADTHFFNLGAGPQDAIKVTALLQAELGRAIDFDALFTVPVFSEFVRTLRELSSVHPGR